MARAASGSPIATSASNSWAPSTKRCSTTRRSVERVRSASRVARRRSFRCKPDSGVRKATGTFYTPQPIADYLMRRDARTARPRRDAGADSRPASARSGDGQRRVSRRRLRVSRRRLRDGARRARPLSSQRPRPARAGGDPSHRRGALSVRRRPESDGGAARPAVAVAGHAGGRPPAQLSRSSPAGRRQPARRVALVPCAGRRRSAPASGTVAAAASTTRRSPTRCATCCRFDSPSRDPNDTPEQVRAKERALAALTHRDSALSKWKRVADLVVRALVRTRAARARETVRRRSPTRS